MKRNLRFVLPIILSFIVSASHAQVTLISNNTNINSGLVLNGVPILISDGGLLYTTNGTSATIITHKVHYTDSSSSGFYKNEVYFAGADATTGDFELWATDGTDAGTRLVKNISAGGSSNPENFFVLNNILYFTATDDTHGEELWKTDGTTANTSLVIDLNGNATSSLASDVSFFLNGSYVLFNAYNSASALGLYKLSASGTVSLVKNNFAGDILLSSAFTAAALGNRTVFTVDTGSGITGASQLWITDGTPANTTILKDFGIGSAELPFTQPVFFNNKIYFIELQLLSGFGLWSTDGTQAGTALVKTISPLSQTAPFPFIATGIILNNKLLFSAGTDATGAELWITDGTNAGTHLVKDINQGADGSSPSFLYNIGAIQNIIASGNSTSFNLHQFFTPFKGKAYFTAFDSTHGTELWSTDGSAANTTLVKDINPGANDGIDGSVGTSFFTTTGIYFAGNNGTSGEEPWVTDGTAAGTTQVYDVKPGLDSSSYPNYQFIYNNQLYFTAQNSGEDTDLYKINATLTVLPVNITSFIASLQTQSVLLNWTTATELNTSRFVLERSVDGVHFTDITSVNAAGNSNSARNYQFNDLSALRLGSTILYYRLRSIDKDGRYTYSSILTVQLHGGSFTYTLSPNPVHSQLTINFTASNIKQATIRITDGNGRAVYEKSLESLQAASVQHNINVSGFANGVYFVQLVTDSGTKTLKFVKQ